jgi:hypothetical protein
MTTIYIQIVGRADGDVDERASHAASLSRFAAELPVVTSAQHSSARAPEGAKGFGFDLAGLVVGITGGLPGFVAAVESWRKRQRAGTIRIEIDGDVLELSDGGGVDQAALIRAWLARRGPSRDARA